MKIVNNEDLTAGEITQQMLEKRPLPIGKIQFMDWSDRIISGACLEANPESLRFVLAEILQHIGPTEDFKEDAYFIKRLRQIAVKETAFNMFKEIKMAHEERKKAEDTAPNLGVVDGVLENKSI